MVKSDEAIKSEWQQMDSVEHILDVIRNHEYDIRRYLADTVAALCDVDVETMLTDCDKIYISQARSLYWYAYRYMTNESYEKIVDATARIYGKRFTIGGIANAVTKMSSLIESEPLWKKRWTIIKRIIKLRDTNTEEREDNTIVIQVPRDIKDKIQILIKDK